MNLSTSSPLDPHPPGSDAGSAAEAPAILPCPVCSTLVPADAARTTHRSCPVCRCRFRDPGGTPAPGPDAPAPAGDRGLDGLCRRWLPGRPGRILQLGRALPLGRQLEAEGWMPAAAGPALTPTDFDRGGWAQVRGPFDLVTVAGFFEHLGDPVAALGRLRDLTADHGLVLLRLPDHGVAGFDARPDTPALAVHHCLDSVLELIAQGGDRLALAATRPLEGSGARDLALRPVKANPGPGWEPGLEAAARSRAADPATGPTPRIPAVALFRPGAIGDVLMTLNLVPALRERYPGHLIHYYCHRWIGDQLGPLMQMAGITEWRDMDGFPDRAWAYGHAFTLRGYPLGEGFPRRPMARHLLQYFAAELGLDDSGLPALSLPLPALDGLPRPYATLHPTARWSAYKNWPLERWAAVLRACPDIPVYQIGAADDQRVPGARPDFLGTPLMAAVALVANANVHLGVDSFTNHLSHFRWNGRQVPSVILWGSSQRTASGYPHNVNLCLDLPCQPCFREDPALSMFPQGLGPCPHPSGQTYDSPRHACMDGISVDRVASELRRLWDQG